MNPGSRPIQAPPEELDADEDLGRGVFDSRKSKRARKGSIDFKIFLESEQAESISVDRMDHAPIDELAEWSRERARNRGPSRQFYGWAVLKVRAAAANGRTVKATPKPQNRCHADIFLNVTGEERRRQQTEHAIRLAAHSWWRDAPAVPDSG